MIRIKNIELNGNIVRAHVIIVSWVDENFDIAIDLRTEEIIENTRGKMDSYVFNAKMKLLESYNENGGKFPKVLEVVWY